MIGEVLTGLLLRATDLLRKEGRRRGPFTSRAADEESSSIYVPQNQA